MIVAALLLAASLDDAQAAFANGAYPEAESLALAAAEPPHAGAALYLAALARFRAGRAADALEALDAAAKAADPPEAPLWHYNRAACLYELQRFGESVLDYEQAAADPSLAAVSLVNAGFAAFDAGSPEQARMLADRARPVASGPALELLADLDAHLTTDSDAEYRAGLAAFDAGKFAEARAHFRKSSALDPTDGRSRVMSGASALRLGAKDDARDDITRGLALRLGADDARAARAYLSELTARSDWRFALRLGAGVDTDPFQTGLDPVDFSRGGTTTGKASAVGTTDFSVDWRFFPGGDLSYAFDQLAYASSAAQDYSLQQHALGLSLESSIREGLRLGASAGGQLAFTGLSSFSGLQAAASLGAWGAIDESGRSTTRLDLQYTRKHGFSGYEYLSGNRADAVLSQEWRLDPVTFGGGYQFRLEDIGEQASQQPYAYLANILWASARARLSDRLDLDLSAGYESRDYAQAQPGPPERHDDRWFGGAAASLWLTKKLALSMRYDLVLNRSNAAPLSYDKHLFTLGTAWAW